MGIREGIKNKRPRLSCCSTFVYGDRDRLWSTTSKGLDYGHYRRDGSQYCFGFPLTGKRTRCRTSSGRCRTDSRIRDRNVRSGVAARRFNAMAGRSVQTRANLSCHVPSCNLWNASRNRRINFCLSIPCCH